MMLDMILYKEKEIVISIATLYEFVLKWRNELKDYRYVPVNNSMLAKAEIPFLIFEKNRGKCFIEKY